MKPLRALIWTAAVVLAVSLGCKGGSGKPRVAFVSNNPESFWTIAQAGATKAAQEADVELLFRMPTSGDASVQKEVIDTVVNQGVKAVANDIAFGSSMPASIAARIHNSNCAIGSPPSSLSSSSPCS